MATTQTGSEVFAAKLAKIQAQIETLQMQAMDHFGVSPEEADSNWGHAGDLDRISGLLAQALGEEA